METAFLVSTLLLGLGISAQASVDFEGFNVGTGTGSDPFKSVRYSDSGMNVTLEDAAANGNIHNYGGGIIPAGEYSPDSTGGINLNSVIGSQNDSGTWTLFFADTSTRGGASMLNSWEFDIPGVPEPANVALAIFGVLVVGVGAAKALRAKR